jgi:3-oxoacyl-[acyl-carrier protein] reductase
VGFTGTDHEIHYGAAKAAIVGFTKSLAREVAPWGITANAIAPGTVETDMTAGMTREEVEANLRQVPLGRLGRPEDIAHAAAFLASEEASWITGQTFHVNGGEFMA